MKLHIISCSNDLQIVEF